MNDNISNRVIDVIARVNKIERKDILLSRSLEELGMDSFDAINLIFALEEEFDVTLPDEAKDYRFIGEIITGIETLQNESVSSAVVSASLIEKESLVSRE